MTSNLVQGNTIQGTSDRT